MLLVADAFVVWPACLPSCPFAPGLLPCYVGWLCALVFAAGWLLPLWPRLACWCGCRLLWAVVCLCSWLLPCLPAVCAVCWFGCLELPCCFAPLPLSPALYASLRVAPCTCHVSCGANGTCSHNRSTGQQRCNCIAHGIARANGQCISGLRGSQRPG